MAWKSLYNFSYEVFPEFQLCTSLDPRKVSPLNHRLFLLMKNRKLHTHLLLQSFFVHITSSLRLLQRPCLLTVCHPYTMIVPYDHSPHRDNYLGGWPKNLFQFWFSGVGSYGITRGGELCLEFDILGGNPREGCGD